MADQPPDAIVYVTYTGQNGSRFDRDYYVSSHLPLVLESWQRYGLLSAKAFFPSGADEGTIAICECRFRDMAAVQDCFEAVEAAAVMADVADFTDLAPERSQVVPL